MKIRLHRGPFDSKVLDHSDGGKPEIVLTGTKKMSHRKRWEYEREWFTSNKAMYYPSSRAAPLPIVTARYRMATILHHHSNGIVTTVPCYHPDGSIFYTWTGEKREG